MLVVADSSPLIVLITIGHVGVLPELFGKVIVPPDVAAQLRVVTRAQPVRDFIAHAPPWLIERTPVVVEPIPRCTPVNLQPSVWSES